MDKTYTPADIETKWYAHWEESGAFKADPEADGEPYAIIMPPPNVTGSLHMGHALDDTLQDVLIRFERLRGKNVLYQPGTDHAGIATQMVVERMLDKEGVKRTDLGREKFLERVWAWKAESGGTITGQLRRLGASCDWSREAFTMDDPRQAAVTRKFVQLFKDGLIYRDKRLVNWDPKLKTAISDLEVEQKEVDGHYWHFRYPIEGTDQYIVVATTRPETMLGDTGVAVHPDDERYKDLVGKMVRLPIVDRLIPIVADDYADPEQGSGAVKITPAHDFNDFEVGRRAGLEKINILDENACINENAPEAYQGMDRFDARKAIVAEFERLGLLEKIEPTRHMVPYGDRGGVVIEPWLTDQWYVDAETMAKPAIEAVESGKTKFVPANWTKTYFEWMRNIQPWCVSRQLWWGHRIPAWYAEDGSFFVAETEEEAYEAARAKLGPDVSLVQDSDVLDTWFSSAMWPYSTLDWPDTNSKALQTWYPGATLVTGFDIIFFWVARMMMSGLHFMGEVPFETVYIHALVRDQHGAKMSKSKGNVIDPLDYIERFGADALRFTLSAMEAQGRDIKLAESRVEGYRNFGTKLWNAARFCQMNDIGGSDQVEAPAANEPVNQWIIGEVAKTTQALTAALDAFRFNDAADAIYHFTWGTFCDWYLELIKPIMSGNDADRIVETRRVAGWALDQILVLLHPFMPFITEEIWHGVKQDRAYDLIKAQWPTVSYDAGRSGDEVNWVIRFISEIRSVRAEMNVPAGAKATALVVGASAETEARLSRWAEMLNRLARLEKAEAVASAESKGAAQLVVDEATIYLPLAELMDIDAEKARLDKAVTKLEKEAGGIRGRLGNEKFLAKAPEAVVAEARENLADLDARIAKMKEAIVRLG